MMLEKCPFCGSDKLKVGHKTKYKDPWKKIIHMNFYVICNCCHARGGTVSGDIPYGDQSEALTEAKEKAIEKWNMRC